MRLIKLFALFAQYNLKRDLEFRFNSLIQLVLYLGWFGLTLLSVELIFGRVSAVAGWRREEVYILSGVYLLFLSAAKTVYYQSFRKFTEAIRTGYFDFWLLKPVSTRFLASVNRIEWNQAARFLAAMVILFSLLKNFAFSPNLSAWIKFVIVFSAGYVALYSLTLITATTVFWFTNLFNLNDLWNEIYGLANKPAQIYRGILEPVFFVAIPVALVATLPTQALLGKLSPVWFASSPFIALGLLALSHGFWRFAISRYTSASS
jgi:ABC-2 type transport system permease protein